jgi:hypothetical protein
MGTGIAILERSGGFDVKDPPGLGISSNPSLCVSLLDFTLRCCIFAPALLVDLPCFPTTLMMVASSANYSHRNCCSISLQIITKMFQSPVLAAAILPHSQVLFNIVSSTLPKLAPLEVLRVAGSAIRGILMSLHGVAIDSFITGALMQPAYAQVSVALKQRFVATALINIGNDAKFCSFVRDFAMVCFPFPDGPLSFSSWSKNLFFWFPLTHPLRCAGRWSLKTASLLTKLRHRPEQRQAMCILADGT